MKKLTYLFASVFLFSCQDALDFYLGVPMQPDFEEDQFIPGLNIFGVIRTDTTANLNNSIIDLERVMRAVGDTGDLEIDTAQIKVTLYNGMASKDVIFKPSTYNGIFDQTHYRPVGDFYPKEGQLLAVECSYENLPILTATTIIPNKPEIVDGSFSTTNNDISFFVESDTSFQLLDVYVYIDSDMIDFLRIPTTSDADIQISFNALPAGFNRVDIYAYDANLSNYILTSNTSLNFNKYREPYSTVENGYGVFGSINYLMYTF